MQKLTLLIGLLIGLTFVAAAQKPDTLAKKSKADSLQLKRDSLNSKPFAPKAPVEKVYHPDSMHSPHTAVMRSLLIPGMGQLYNRKWWKLPIIYGGLGLIAWAYLFNEKNYTENLAIARYRHDGTAPVKGDKYYDLYQQYAFYNYPDQSIYNAVTGYRRNRDLSVLGFAALWGINVIDAYIDAKFIHSYTMDNNFSMRVRPSLIEQPVYAGNLNGLFIPGLKFTFTLR
jgi:hypothetical protein